MAVHFEKTVIGSIDEMSRAASKAENAGRTFEVTQPVFKHYAAKLKVLPNTAGDIKHINHLLGASLSASSAMGLTRVCTCANCGHQFTFADHIESAIMIGAHSAAELRTILSGGKFHLTVDTEKPREIQCPKCQVKSFQPHCCYVTDDYAYV
jgi:hypothetical protein